jgi:hypothetical protein
MFLYQSTQSKEIKGKHQNQKPDEHGNNLLMECYKVDTVNQVTMCV